MTTLQIRTEARKTRPAYVYRHVVTLEETNAMVNVYFTRHIAWQGRCRELFLKEHARSIFDDFRKDLRLVTLNTQCEYYDELHAGDEVQVHMMLAHLRQHRIGLDFHYEVQREAARLTVAHGRQEIACMRLEDGALSPVAVPDVLANALRSYE